MRGKSRVYGVLKAKERISRRDRLTMSYLAEKLSKTGTEKCPLDLVMTLVRGFSVD